MTIDGAVRLARYVSDAARLRSEIAPYEFDRRELDNGGDISYAVDTNLVMLYLRPHLHGPRSECGEGGYGVVFHDDPPKTSDALGAVLSRFVFYNLTGDAIPLILLPGHDAEIRGMYEAVVRKATEEIAKVESQLRELPTILEELSGKESMEAQLEYLEKKTPDLLSYLYYSEDATVERSRFDQLLLDHRILRLVRALEGFDGHVSHDVRRAYAAPFTLKEQVLESTFRVAWERRLEFESPKRVGWRLRPDCTALARLELINHMLLRQREVSHRMVLITGDEAMIRAAAKYEPIPGDRRTFLELYLRHPRAFLATPMVVLSGEARTRTVRSAKADFVSDWLETLLVRYTGDGGVDDARLRDLVACSSDLKELAETYADGDVKYEDLERSRDDASTNRRNALTLIRRAWRVVDKDPDAPVRIKVEWKNHFRQVAMDHAGASPIGRAALERALRAARNQDADTALQDVGTALRDLNRRLLAKIEQTWTEFNRALTLAGFELLLDDETPDTARASERITRKRNAPPVFMESCEWANCFVRQMMVTDDLFGLFRNELEKLETLGKNEPTGYVQSLVFALVFANAERWHVAALFARRAISIAERVRGEEASGAQRPSGREAYYLSSFATRIRAQGEPDLSEAESLLGKAEEALIQDQTREHPVTITNVRFRAERLALDLERHLLLEFCRKSAQADRPARALDKVFADLVKLHGELKCEREDWLRENVKRRVVTNAFMIAALMDTDGSLPEQVNDFCTNQWKSLKSSGDDRYSIPMTRLTSAVADYAVARFGCLDESKILDMYHRAAELQRAIKERDHAVLLTRYDRRRFELLIRCTRSALASRR